MVRIEMPADVLRELKKDAAANGFTAHGNSKLAYIGVQAESVDRMRVLGYEQYQHAKFQSPDAWPRDVSEFGASRPAFLMLVFQKLRDRRVEYLIKGHHDDRVMALTLANVARSELAFEELLIS